MQTFQRIITVAILLGGFTCLPGQAQEPAPATAPAVPIQAADVASADAILAALYDTISGPAGARATGRGCARCSGRMRA